MLYQGIIGGGSSPVEPVDLSPVLLWTNPSPTSAFEPQTISLDLTEYVGVIIEYNLSTQNQLLLSRIYLKKNDNLSPLSGWYFGSGGGTNRAYSRGISQINNEGILFLDCVDGITSPTNTGLIPTKIYGVKEYVVEPFKPIDATVCERAYTFPATSETTNTWTVNEDGLYLVGGTAPGLEDSRGSITFIGEATLISGSDGIRVFTAKAGAQVKLTVASGNTFTPYINIIK